MIVYSLFVFPGQWILLFSYAFSVDIVWSAYWCFSSSGFERPFLFGLLFSCWNTLNLCLHTFTQYFSTSFALQQHEYRARYWNTLGRSTPSEKGRILFFFISLMRDWFHFFLNRLMVHPVPFGLIETSTPKTKVWQGLLIPRRSSRLVASSWSSVKASWKSFWKRWLILSESYPFIIANTISSA